MGSFSIWHWLIVLLVVVLIFGTKKLRNMGSDVGGAIKEFKDSMADATSTTSQQSEHLETRQSERQTVATPEIKKVPAKRKAATKAPVKKEPVKKAPEKKLQASTSASNPAVAKKTVAKKSPPAETTNIKDGV